MTRKEILQRLHHKSSRTLFESVLSVALFFSLLAVTVFAWENGYWPLVFIGWLLQAHIGHTNLLAFHEASHFTLHPSRRVNELQGIILGSVVLTPLSAYRWVHNQHHIHLGTQRDTELWPFVDPHVKRWRRLLTVVAELLLGFFYTPIIFLRGVLVAQRIPRATVRRLVWEYALCVALWGVILSAAIRFGVTKEFVVGYLIPAMLAGNLQSLRKFTEHVGLLGHDVPSTTRTVIDPSIAGQLLSASMLHIDLHGPHHLHAKIPHFHLPKATPIAYEEELYDPVAANVFPSYVAAFWAMAGTLLDPRVGAQWLARTERAVLVADSPTTSAANPPAVAIRTTRSNMRAPRSLPETNRPAHIACLLEPSELAVPVDMFQAK